jgi:hypothetical protein
MSWGGSEFPGETSYDSTFTTPTGHTPITFVAASGDSGAWYGSSWPASSPNVVAIGGTSLFTSATGQGQFEMGWNGSGGGFSSYESEPSYQTMVQNTGVRTTPDVSLNADPWSGYYTYTTTPSTGQGSWELVGGTSASTQIWAGILAKADQVRTSTGKSTLSTATTLSTLYGTPSAFNDITWGSNGYWAGPGYDLVTGLGTPRGSQLIAALAQAGSSPSAGVVTVAPASSHTTASGAPHDVVLATTTPSPTSALATPATIAVIAPSLPAAQAVLAPPTASAPASAAAPETTQSFASPVAQGFTTALIGARALYQGADVTPHIEPVPAPTPSRESPATDLRPAAKEGAEMPDILDVTFPRSAGSRESTGAPVEAPQAPGEPRSTTPPKEDDPDDAPRVSGLGLAIVATTAMAVRIRLRPRSKTPQGPRALLAPWPFEPLCNR